MATLFAKAPPASAASSSSSPLPASSSSVSIKMNDAPPQKQQRDATLPLFSSLGPAQSPVSEAAMFVRRGFLNKVYAILCIQLSVTVCFCTWFSTSPSAKQFVAEHSSLLFVAVIASFVNLFALIAKRKEHPTNLFLLGSMTLLEAFIVANVVAQYPQKIVLQALFLTASITTGLTLYTFQTKYDYTSWGAGLVSALWCLIGVSVVSHIVPFSDSTEMAFSFFGASLFSAFIIIDTQMIMKKLSVDEYILGALNLYLDIINLFLELLKILSKRD